MGPGSDAKQLHFDLVNVGLRAQATAAGLVQLCRELQSAGVLSQTAVDRIKDAITNEIGHAAPRHLRGPQYRSDARARLDRIFAGDQQLGEAADLRASIEGEANG